jgi:hypothetical protein
LIILALLSAYTAHFSIGAVDRITHDELQATNYLVSLNRPMVIYAGGFTIPLPEGYGYVSAHRGDIELDRIHLADAVIVSPQMKNALLLNPRTSASLQDLYTVLENEFYEAYVTGQVEVYIRNP